MVGVWLVRGGGEGDRTAGEGDFEGGGEGGLDFNVGGA
jgi:hypothetical protein